MAVGEANNILLQYPDAEKQDMEGRVILPGLTDAHLHLKHYALSLQKVDCETDTKEECLRRVEERAQKVKPGEWILGHGWNQNTWGVWPTASELDAIAPNNPVYLTAKSLPCLLGEHQRAEAGERHFSNTHPQNGQIQRDEGVPPLASCWKPRWSLSAVWSRNRPSLRSQMRWKRRRLFCGKWA